MDDDGTATITTQDNETYQDDMLNDLFGAQNFNDLDRDVDIIEQLNKGAPRGGPSRGTSVVSRYSRHSRSASGSLISEVSATSRRARAAANNGSKPPTPHSLMTDEFRLHHMEVIDEDIHNLVREDVRKMIAKIRSAKQNQPTSSAAEQQAEEGREQLVVRPGKYGEGDLRRKQLFDKIRKDKVKKRETHASKATQQAKPASTAEHREGARESPEETSKPEKTTTTGGKKTSRARNYYKNQPEESPEHYAPSELFTKDEKKQGPGPAQNNETSLAVASESQTKRKRAETPFTGPAQPETRILENTKGKAEEKKAEKAEEKKEEEKKEEKTEEESEEKVEEEAEDAASVACDATHASSIQWKAQIDEDGKMADEEKTIECVLTIIEDGEDVIEEFGEEVELEHLTLEKPDPSEDEDVVEKCSYSEPADEDLEDDDEEEGKKKAKAERRSNARAGRAQDKSEGEGEGERRVRQVPIRNAEGKKSIRPDPQASLGRQFKDASQRKKKGGFGELVKSLSGTVQTILSMDQSDAGLKNETDTTNEDEGTVELVLVDDAQKVQQLEIENAKLRSTLRFLQSTAVDKEKYFAELAWFGKRSEQEIQQWRPNFWKDRLEDFGPELFEEFRADAMRIADPDIGDWEHGFSSGSLAMARLLLGLSHVIDDEKICAFHTVGQACTPHCVTCSVEEQRKRELDDFPVLDP